MHCRLQTDMLNPTLIRPVYLLATAAAAIALLVVACGGQSADTVSMSSGDTVAPEFTLPNANALPGSAISLSQYREHKPVVLVFYRAYW